MTVAKRYLVTGGAGFIGSHLCQRLLEQGNQVICLDDFTTGSPLNIAHLLDHPNFCLVEHDVIQPLPALEVEAIFNLACPASPVHYQRDPVRTIRTSVLGALHALELAQHLGAPVLQASTSEVYGDPAMHPQTELYWGNVNPIGLRACYDEGKRCAEAIFFDYHRQYGIEIKVGRIFNTYGPHMHPADGRVVSNFLVQALQNQPITVFGQGTQTRSFCYVEDLVEALLRLMATEAGVCGPINLGNPEEFTILELVQLIREITGSGSELIFLPLPQDDPRQRRPDISLARQFLAWEPSTRLREGLILTAAYFEEILRRSRTELKASRSELLLDNPALVGRGL
ncbi:MAG: SDR family oxidoreductase [Desulfuromonadales bacterium]|nr:SDR family oxidoreductase [Desulfuromonadales bacterium]